MSIISVGHNKRITALSLSIIFSAFLLWYLFRDIDFSSFWQELSKANLVYVVLMVLTLYLSLHVRVLRWAYILPDTKFRQYKPLFQATVIGFFASFLLPFRAGEFIRPLIASKLDKISFGSAFASIVTERIFDVLSLLALFAISFSSLNSAPDWVPRAALGLGVLTAILCLLVLSAYLAPEKIKDIFSKIINCILGKTYPKVVGKVTVLFNDFVAGLRAIESLKELLFIFLWSTVLWGLLSIYYQLGLFAMGEFPSWQVGIVVNCMIALAVAAPSAPGFFGVFQLGCVIALSYVYSYSNEFALAYSLIVHLLQYQCIVVLGVFCLQRAGLSFSTLTRSQN